MSDKNRGLQQIHLAVLLFGLAGLIGKAIILPSALIVLGRVLFASMALGGIICISNDNLHLNSRRDAMILMFLGFILSAHWLSFFHSIKVSTVAVGLLGYSTFPIFAAFIEPIVFDERVGARDAAAAFAAFLGAAVLIPSFELSNNITRGLFWGILSGLTFAVLSVMNRKFVSRYSGLIVAFYEDAVAAILLMPVLFLFKFTLSWRNILLLFFLGVVSTAAAHSLFISGMRYVKARTASIIASLEPIYGILFALLFLREVPSLRTLLGGALILGAAIFATLFSKEGMKRSPVSQGND
jgi:drug/metabolite transporter (DMT)-like permease